MSGVLIKGVTYKGEVVDLLTHGPVVEITAEGCSRCDNQINGHGLIACPAFSDDHTHFRDPGLTEKEDLLSGSRAAAAGGYAFIECEPNTRPVIDTFEKVIKFRQHVHSLHIPIQVSTKVALTIGQYGEELVDIDGLLPYVSAFSDDGEPILNRALLSQAFMIGQASDETVTVTAHCEETPRSKDHVRSALGDGQALHREPDIIKLNIEALRIAGVGHLHIQHVSLAESLPIIADAKKEGLHVTAEVAPHHLLLCEDDIPMRDGAPDANWKMNPPLRSREDMMAMRRALSQGIIDYIATDHAPHTIQEKARPWDDAPFGVIGLETAFASCFSLIQQGDLSLMRLLDALSAHRYSSLKLNALWGGLTLIDPDHVWTVDPDKFYSKARNCPFAGMTFRGKPMYTIAGGRVVMAEGEVLF